MPTCRKSDPTTVPPDATPSGDAAGAIADPALTPDADDQADNAEYDEIAALSGLDYDLAALEEARETAKEMTAIAKLAETHSDNQDVKDFMSAFIDQLTTVDEAAKAILLKLGVRLQPDDDGGPSASEDTTQTPANNQSATPPEQDATKQAAYTRAKSFVARHKAGRVISAKNAVLVDTIHDCAVKLKDAKDGNKLDEEKSTGTLSEAFRQFTKQYDRDQKFLTAKMAVIEAELAGGDRGSNRAADDEQANTSTSEHKSTDTHSHEEDGSSAVEVIEVTDAMLESYLSTM